MASHKKKKKYETRLSVRKLDDQGKPYKTKEKPGKVVRVPEDVWSVLQTLRRPRESVASMLKRLLRAESELFYMLPESMLIFRSEAEARGKAIVISVMSKRRGQKSVPEAVLPVKVMR